MSNRYGYIGVAGPTQSEGNLPKKYKPTKAIASGGTVTYDGV